jgi:hypothetical protein
MESGAPPVTAARSEYNHVMAEIDPQYVEGMPADFDRFVGGFFPRKAWSCHVKYDHRDARLFLEVTLADARLSGDDRFLTLIAFYARSQRLFLRENAGIELQCRLLNQQGADLTDGVRGAESHLDDEQTGPSLGRRLAWLGFRRRFVRSFLPRTVLWAGVIAVLTYAVGFSLTLSVGLCLIATLLQAVLTGLTVRRSG